MSYKKLRSERDRLEVGNHKAVHKRECRVFADLILDDLAKITGDDDESRKHRGWLAIAVADLVSCQFTPQGLKTFRRAYLSATEQGKSGPRCRVYHGLTWS